VQFSEDAKLAGWTRDIQNSDSAGYSNTEMLMAFLMTTPGVPCIYYGDEIGMPGGNDPDNRRMMHFADWNNAQQTLQLATQKLVNIRRSCLALSYGDLEVLYNKDGVLVFARKYFDSAAIIVLSKQNLTDSLAIDLPKPYQSTKYMSCRNSNYSCTGEQLILKGNSGYEVFYQ
jgi:glycosidase